MSDPSTSVAAQARTLWTLIEPIHAVTYFAPQCRAATEAIGLRGFWRGYFAGRLAPLGRVEAPLATAVLFGFSPSMVARAVPEIWSSASPEVVLDARLTGAGAALDAAGLTADAAGRAADLLKPVLAAADGAGRAIFAANAALPVAEDPHQRLWQLCTAVREHRGDGHVAALTSAGLTGAEALVSHVAALGPSRDALQPNRGWTDEQWNVAIRALTVRGWLDADGVLTALGRTGREAVEAATDSGAGRPLEAIGSAGTAALLGALSGVAATVVDADLIPYPNPMGVPRPAAGLSG